MKYYCWTRVCCMFNCLLTGQENTWALIKTMQHTFTVRYPMIFRGTETYCCHGHVCIGIVNMTTMRSYCTIIGFKNTTGYFTRPYVLRIVTSVFEIFQTTIVPC